MIEKERKFLLKYMPELGSYFKEPKLIKQGYLMLDKKKQLRIRITNDFHCHICYKQTISKEEKYEFEYLIPKEQGLKLYELSEFKLEKKRYTTFFKDYNVDIDVYPSGLSVVEIEFREDLKEIPDYCGKEITGEKEFSNIEIAKMNNQFFA
jgi:CYTH domain-containing protein